MTRVEFKGGNQVAWKYGINKALVIFETFKHFATSYIGNSCFFWTISHEAPPRHNKWFLAFLERLKIGSCEAFFSSSSTKKDSHMNFNGCGRDVEICWTYPIAWIRNGLWIVKLYRWYKCSIILAFKDLVSPYDGCFSIWGYHITSRHLKSDMT